MSLFLYLSVPKIVSPNVRDAFDSSVKIIDATDTPIGLDAKGRKSWPVYMLLHVAYSERLVKSKKIIPGKRLKRLDQSHLLMSGLQSLMNDENCIFVALLAHWMHGNPMTEKMSVKGEKNIKFCNIENFLTNEMEVDILYKIENDTKYDKYDK